MKTNEKSTDKTFQLHRNQASIPNQVLEIVLSTS